MGIPFDVLNEMPIRDRKYYIMRHNMETSEDNARKNGTNNSLNDGESINTYAGLEQSNILNAQKR